MHDLRIPLELIGTILDQLDRGSFLALRSANKAFNALTTPRAFHELMVTDTVESADGLRGIQSTFAIANYVTSIVFRGSAPEFPENDLTGPAAEYDTKLAAVPSAFAGLSKLPQLVSLRFEFNDDCNEEDWDTTENPSYFFRMQCAILQAAVSAPLPALKFLTLTNLIALPYALYESQAFAEFLRPLEALSIDVSGPDDLSEGIFASTALVEFWEQMAPILCAAQSVSSLRLASNGLIGITPNLTFPTTPLPNLTSLSLTNVCFHSEDFPGCPESFILLHSAHLTHLTLKDCPLNGYDQVWARSWAAVLANLEVKMQALRSFSIGGDKALEYTYEDMGWGFITLDAEELGIDGRMDQPALQALVATVEARNLGKETQG
ncbi:hypothetical protein FB451DRAFT_1259336 [Mycena latifolia]|nr:hypothetical protein FB451DRAFT_1259336 [Mycena latifolia]